LSNDGSGAYLAGTLKVSKPLNATNSRQLLECLAIVDKLPLEAYPLIVAKFYLVTDCKMFCWILERLLRCVSRLKFIQNARTMLYLIRRRKIDVDLIQSSTGTLDNVHFLKDHQVGDQKLITLLLSRVGDDVT